MIAASHFVPMRFTICSPRAPHCCDYSPRQRVCCTHRETWPASAHQKRNCRALIPLAAFATGSVLRRPVRRRNGNALMTILPASIAQYPCFSFSPPALADAAYVTAGITTSRTAAHRRPTRPIPDGQHEFGRSRALPEVVAPPDAPALSPRL